MDMRPISLSVVTTRNLLPAASFGAARWRLWRLPAAAESSRRPAAEVAVGARATASGRA